VYAIAKEHAEGAKDILVFLDFDDVVAFKYNEELDQSEFAIMQQLMEPGADFDAILPLVEACTKQLIPGIKPLLQSIANDGVDICIVTKQSKDKSDIHDILEREQLNDDIKMIIHQYDIEKGTPVTIGGIQYSAPPSVTVSKGSLIRQYIIDHMAKKSHEEESSKIVVFVDDIVYNVQDAKAAFYTLTREKAKFKTIFAYPENGGPVDEPWKIDKTFL